jgi:hypothetical protein
MEPRYKTLVGADIYRDGGSLEVKFVCCNGEFETLWLQAAPESPNSRQLIHDRLLVFSDLERQVDPVLIERDSSEETCILDSLKLFVSESTVDVPFAHRTPDQVYLGTVNDLIEAIPRRK